MRPQINTFGNIVATNLARLFTRFEGSLHLRQGHQSTQVSHEKPKPIGRSCQLFNERLNPRDMVK